jgi:hypothetical protein
LHIKVARSVPLLYPIAVGRDAVLQAIAENSIILILKHHPRLYSVDLNGQGEVGMGVTTTGLQVVIQGFGSIDINPLLPVAG